MMTKETDIWLPLLHYLFLAKDVISILFQYRGLCKQELAMTFHMNFQESLASLPSLSPLQKMSY